MDIRFSRVRWGAIGVYGRFTLPVHCLFIGVIGILPFYLPFSLYILLLLLLQNSTKDKGKIVIVVVPCSYFLAGIAIATLQA
jgi:hypothetical protein